MSYTLKYRTFDSLLADCANDFNESADVVGWTLNNPTGKGEWIYSPD